MYIYLDVIWLLNFLFDGLLLLLTAIILKRKVRKIRVIVGALIGSSIVLLMFTPLAPLASHPIVKLIYSVMITLTTFGYKRFSSFLQTLLTFYFTTFVIGGGMIGVHYFFEYELEITDNVLVTTTTGFGHPVSWGFVLIGFPLVWYFAKKQIDSIEMKKIHYDQIVNVTISIDDSSIELKGLIDSGNQLYDPITKTPVMVVDIERLMNFIPKQLIEQSQNINHLGLDHGNELAHKWESRVRIIPYRGVGQDHQFLLALKPDYITIVHNSELIKVKKALVGLNHTTLSSEGDYDCIVHPKMLTSSSVQPAS